MRIEWLGGEAFDLTCPVCHTPGAKPARLAVGAPGRQRLLVLVECPACGAGLYTDRVELGADFPAGQSALQFYVEQGAGIDVMLGPLFRFPAELVRRYLEVGCGFGFALDFVGRAFGWQGRGMDPSPLGRAGREVLGVDIVSDRLSASSQLGGPFDLVFCSEVIEHTPDPGAFVDALRRQVAPDGALALTTPNMAFIRRCVEERADSSSTLLSALSPGHHQILFSATALERLLRGQGFSHVHLWEEGPALHAVAARRAYPIRRQATVDRELYRTYLADRAATIPAATPLGLGFHYRLFKEWVNAGRYPEARSTFERLHEGCSGMYALDLRRPAELLAEGAPAPDLDGFARRHPFNLTGLLFFQGIVEFNEARAYTRALEYFEAAARAGTTVRAALRSIGADDGESEELVGLAHLHALLCLARLDPARVTAKLLDREGHTPDASGGLPRALARRALLEVFVGLINDGHYAEGERLADAVTAALGTTAEGHQAPVSPIGDRELDALFCLGILTLNHRGEPVPAARLFALVHEQARTACASAVPGVSATALVWPARYCQALALRQAGALAEGAAAAQDLVGGNEPGLPPVAADLQASARELLA